jgi:tetratricopeptide (TPR) repeat protein
MDTSILGDVQHLLRHLHDARVLRSNRLVAELFDDVTTPLEESAALTRVRSLVTTGVRVLRASAVQGASSLDARSYEILDRCDLHGELHRVVASDLGLSERQFYRARSKACSALGDVLLTWRERDSHPVLVANAPTTFVWQLGCAEDLQNLGQFDTAVTLLQKLARESTNPPDRVRALCKAALVLYDSGNGNGVQEVLNEAIAVSLVSASPGERALAEAELKIVKAAHAWATGATDAAITWNRRLLDDLRPFEHLSERGTELAALALLDLGNLYREIGAVTESLAAIGEGRAMIAHLNDPPAAVRSQFDVAIASTLSIMPGSLSAAEHELHEGLDFARRFRLLRSVVDISSMLGIVSLFRGDVDRAAHHGRTAVALAQTVSGPREFGSSALNAARFELIADRPQAAMELVAQARSRLPAGTLHSTMCDLCEAEILIKLGRPQRAAAIAGASVEQLERLNIERYLGSALHVLAEALAAAGDVRKAAQKMDASIAVLEQRGHPFSLARAYAYSAKLTGNARHRNYGRDLYAMLQA